MKNQDLVWLTCKQCRQPIIPVCMLRTAEAPQGRTVIMFQHLTVFRSLVKCPYCGTVRDFRSKKAEAEAR